MVWGCVICLLIVTQIDGECNSQIAVCDIRCEYTANPLGIDNPNPRMSWKLRSTVRGDRQSAYQIVASDNLNLLKRKHANLWNSGKVYSSESLNVTYHGKTLRSNQKVYWSVKIWDSNGNSSHQSKSACFTTGLLAASDWHGKWIKYPRKAIIDETEYYLDRPAPLVRKEFVINKSIKRAVAYAAGLGYFEIHVNGKKVGNHELETPWTTFSKRIFYTTYDLTKSLSQGTNTVGIVLGNGWYNPLPLRMWGHLNLREHLTIGEPRALLELRIEYMDGTHKRVVSDSSWRVSESPILKNSIYLGELFDARKEQHGWDMLSFDASSWLQAAVATQSVGELHAISIPPIRTTRKVLPKSVKEVKPGVFIFDMGQNFAGTVTLHVSGNAGATVTLKYGELLNADGTLNANTSAAGQIKNGNGGPGAPEKAYQTDTYILRGSGLEIYTPRFTWHGFRYVEITGFPGIPHLPTIVGNRMNTDVSQSGMSFISSNELLNRIHTATEWTFLSNLFSVQSDCPHRERFGYGGDIAATSEMAMLHFDMSTFYAKSVIDLEDAVRPNGGFTETAPYVDIADAGLGGGAGPMGWGVAHNLLLWQMYQYYGNIELIRQGYPFAKKYVDLLERTAKGDILSQDISDHESLDPKPVELTATAFYYLNVQLAKKMAVLLGKHADASHYIHMGERIYSAFQKRFCKKGTAQYDIGTQACQSFVLALDLVPKELQKSALDLLIKDIHNHNNHLTTGIFGTKYMLEVLSENGYADIAYQIVSQKRFPGWGFMLENGATTLWEHWEGSDSTFSQNHPMFGSVDEWMTKTVGGIAPASDSVGFNHVLIHPKIMGDLKSASSHYASVRGEIICEWNIENDHLRMHTVIPLGCRAEVTIPAGWDSQIYEGSTKVSQSIGVSFSGKDTFGTHYQVTNGSYTFTSKKVSKK